MAVAATGALRPLPVDDAVRESEWMPLAACIGQDPEMWHPVGSSGPALVQEQAAKAVCSGCPVAGSCLSWSLAMRLEHGIFGGLNADERRVVRARASRERVAS